MHPDQLAARSLELGAQSERKVLGVLAAAGDAGVRPGAELAQLAELEPRTASRALARLEDRGLARRDGKRRAWATQAGRSEAGADTPGLSLAPTLDSALACLPAEALRAFARLQLAAVPARWHLAGEHQAGWAGFIALGPTKTGKTSVAALVCRLYALDEVQAIRLADDETPGSLFARRVRDASSPTGYRLERAALLDAPYACIDEWDKAGAEVQRAASRLLHGATEAETEGERIQVRPTVYIALNTGREGLAALHQAHIRRSVVIDTTPLLALLEDVDEHMHRLFDQTELPRLNLSRIRPPASSLPAPERAVLREELRAGLTDDGWRLTDVEPLARLALGRAALTGSELEHAALATALDYLSCAATLGHARPGFAARLAPRLGGKGALSPDPAGAEAFIERRARADADRQRHAAEAQLALVADRERKAATAVAARDAMGRARDVERQTIARALTAAARTLRAARGADALEHAWQATCPYIEQANAWVTRRDAAEAARQREVDQERHRQELARRERQAAAQAERERQTHARAQQQTLARHDRELCNEIAQLERLAARTRNRPGESPLQVLKSLQVRGRPLIVFERDSLGESGGERALSFGVRLLSAFAGEPGRPLPTGSWQSPFVTIALPGTETTCEQLETWQSRATQRVLAAALAILRAQREQISPRAAAGNPALQADLAVAHGRCTRCGHVSPTADLTGATASRCPRCGGPLQAIAAPRRAIL